MSVEERALLRQKSEQIAALKLQHAEDERLLAEARAALSLGPKTGICSWCGLELYGDTDPVGRIKAHQLECPDHPMRAVERQRDALVAALNGLLDGLDANDDPERCGLSQKQWDERIKDARTARDNAEKEGDR